MQLLFAQKSLEIQELSLQQYLNSSLDIFKGRIRIILSKLSVVVFW